MSPSLSIVNVSFLFYFSSSPSFVHYVFSKYLGVTVKVQDILPGPGNSKVKNNLYPQRIYYLIGDMGNKHIVVCLYYTKEVTTSQLVGGGGRIKVSLNKTENL